MADAAPRVAVGDVDELADRVLAIPGDARGNSLGHRGELAADDQHAVVVAGDVRLDHDIARSALGEGVRKGRPDVVLRSEVEADTAPMIAVERLHDTGKSELARRRRGLVEVLDHLRPGHGHPGRVEKAVRQALVGCDVDPDRRRLRGHRRPDPLLVHPLPELDQAEPIEPDVRDVAADGFVDEGLRRRPERQPLRETNEPLELGQEVERRRG